MRVAENFGRCVQLNTNQIVWCFVLCAGETARSLTGSTPPSGGEPGEGEVCCGQCAQYLLIWQCVCDY
jgi:hypothetical protein